MGRYHRAVLTAVSAMLLAQNAGWSASGVFVATASTDFGTGSTALLPAGSASPQGNLLTIHSDAEVRYFDGRIYVVNRMGQDNILVLDPTRPDTPLMQYSVGNGANPQDIVVVDTDKAYVTLLERDYVLILDPRDGTRLGTIDLSAYADADGLPELAQMVRVEDRVFVGMQRLDRNAFWAPSDSSYLAVIDIKTDALVDADPAQDGIQGILLAAPNPGALDVVDQRIFVQEVGDYMALDGGIEAIDAGTFQSEGLLITESQLGGQCGGLAMASSTHGFTAVSVWPTYTVRPFDLDTRTVGDPLSGTSGGYIPALAMDDDRLLVADRGTDDNLDAAGILVFDWVSGELLEGPISTGLPPNSFAVLHQASTATAIAGTHAAVPECDRLERSYSQSVQCEHSRALFGERSEYPSHPGGL